MGCSVMGKLRSALRVEQGRELAAEQGGGIGEQGVELLPELRMVALEGCGGGFEGVR